VEAGRGRQAWHVLARIGEDPDPRHAEIGQRTVEDIPHATPIVWVGPGRTEERLGLGEMPCKGRPYSERPLTVESLRSLRSVLKNAADGWGELVVALGAESLH